MLDEICQVSEKRELTKQCDSPSPLETLQRRKVQLQDQLSRVDDAIKALEEHPEVTKVLELLSKARY